MTAETVTKKPRPARDEDIEDAMALLREAWTEWWYLGEGDYAVDEAEQPDIETVTEVVALFVARARGSRLFAVATDERRAAFIARIQEALENKLEDAVLKY
jgi:hypothetical protein